MAMDTYLQLDGVTGESTRQNFGGWIEIDGILAARGGNVLPVDE